MVDYDIGPVEFVLRELDAEERPSGVGVVTG